MGLNSTTLQLRLKQFSEENREDFDAVHCDANDAGVCRCVAWWVSTWDGWSERTAEQNRKLRDELCARGEYDGYILYVDRQPAGWVQVGPRDRLAKLVSDYQLEPDPEAWAITCFLIVPKHRDKGLTTYMLHQLIADLRRRGVKRVEAFPRPDAKDASDLWTGPVTTFESAGFQLAKRDPAPVYVLEL